MKSWLELLCFINNIRTKEQSISKYNKTNKGHSSINSATQKGKYYSEGNLPTSTENDDQSWWLPVRCNNQTPPTSLRTPTLSQEYGKLVELNFPEGGDSPLLKIEQLVNLVPGLMKTLENVFSEE